MKRWLAKLDVRWDDLSGVDRLALVGRQGRGALVYEPACGRAGTKRPHYAERAVAVSPASAPRSTEPSNWLMAIGRLI